jgi:sec-independent protein translocase protein TatB
MHLGDTIFIFCLALIIFGPKKLPEIGRQIGKLMVEFRRASNDFKMQIEEELRAAEEADRQKEITAAVIAPATNAKPVEASSLLAAAAATNETASAGSIPSSSAVEPGVELSADSSAHSPMIAPPSTGLPVSHSSFEYSEPATASDEAVEVFPDAYPDPGNGFNAGLNTASNGAVSETSVAETTRQMSAAEAARTEMQESEAESSQAATHHG